MATLGLNIPIGAFPEGVGLSEMAQTAEATGASSLWVPDHIVQVAKIYSEHPFSAGGKAGWAADTPWMEAMSTLTWLAASTERIRIGTSVLVLPQRDPVLVAKQAATIDVLSGGRVTLGLGAGWMREEFEILGWDFKSRGRRLEEAMQVMRACWLGAPAAFDGEFFSLPEGVMAYPRPVQDGGIPLLVGGMADVALRRAGRVGDGWLALVPLARRTDAELETVVEEVRAQLAMAEEARPGHLPPMRNRIGLGLVEEKHLPLVSEIGALGFDEVVVNSHWADRGALKEHVQAVMEALR